MASIAPVTDLVRRRADLVERQDVMVGARVHFGIPKPPDTGVLVPVVGDVDDEARSAGADVGVRRLDAIDDETTMVYNWVYTRKSAPLSDEDRLERAIGNGPEHVDQTTFRSKANRDNAYLIDRAVQKTETFTGIDGINVQDRAIQESMGPICDRSKEHLGPADKGIIQMRRLLREAINTVRAGAPQPVSGRATTISIAHCRYCRATPTGAKSSRPITHRRRYCRRCEGIEEHRRVLSQTAELELFAWVRPCSNERVGDAAWEGCPPRYWDVQMLGRPYRSNPRSSSARLAITAVTYVDNCPKFRTSENPVRGTRMCDGED